MKWIDKQAHEIMVDNLYEDENGITRISVSQRFLYFYCDIHYNEISDEFFYVLYGNMKGETYSEA